MESPNQLLLDPYHDQGILDQRAFNRNLLSSVAGQENYAPRSLRVASHGQLSQNNIANYGIAAVRTTLGQRLSPEQYTSGGYHNAVSSYYGAELSPYHNIYARPDLSNAYEQRPTFNEYDEPTGNEYIGQPPEGEQHYYDAGYNSPDPTEGSDMSSEHLAGLISDSEPSQELSSTNAQVLDDKDDGVNEQDEDDDEQILYHEDEGVDQRGYDDDDDDDDDDESDDENEGDHDEDEGATNDESNDTADASQDANPAPKRKQKPKDFGEIRKEPNGSLSYRAKTGSDKSPWVPATYLTPEVRQEMISEMSKFGKYKYPRDSGEEAYDQTCFHPDQKDWGIERVDWPEILFKFNKPEPPKKRKRSSPIKNMVHKGRILIAYGSNKPIRDFPNIPLCLSTKVERWLLEAWSRQDQRINLQDFCDRMPKPGRPKAKDLSMRRSRFRWEKGLKSWVTRSATDRINAWLDIEVPKIYRDANSTRGWGGLTSEKTKELHELCKGQFPERARKAKRAQRAAEVPESGSSGQIVDQSQMEQSQDDSAQSTGSSKHTQAGVAPVDDQPQQTTKPALARPKKTPKSRKSSGVNRSTMSTSATDSEESDSDDNLGIGAEQNQPHPVDYRDQIPSTEAEKRAVQRALALTRQHIQEVLGIPTRPTDKDAPYNEQWIALRQWCHTMAISADIPEPLSLPQHEAWLDGFPQQIFMDTCELPETAGAQL